jgi:transcriptional regulator with XRE-family HTH domain
MKIPESVCSLDEIGKRAEEARLEANIKEDEFAAALDLSPQTLWYYKQGKREWGCQALAAAAVLCGKTPNDFLLRQKPRTIAGPQFQEFDSEDRDNITAALVDLAFLKELEGPVRATEIFAVSIREVADKFRKALKDQEDTLPAGTVIERDGDTTKMKAPPASSKAERTQNKVSEDAAPYAKPKSKKKPK